MREKHRALVSGGGTVASRTRRRFLKALSVSSLSLAAPAMAGASEYVVIDGWVMRRREVDPGRTRRGRRRDAR